MNEEQEKMKVVEFTVPYKDRIEVRCIAGINERGLRKIRVRFFLKDGAGEFRKVYETGTPTLFLTVHKFEDGRTISVLAPVSSIVHTLRTLRFIFMEEKVFAWGILEEIYGKINERIILEVQSLKDI